MKIRPDDRVLELGCGAGIAVSVIAAHLENGQITAVDRSEKMIAMAAKRNAGAIAASKVKLEHCGFADFNTQNRFDVIFASNVIALWRNEGDILVRLREFLKEKGRIFLFFQTLHHDPDAAEQAMLSGEEQLLACGYRAVKKHSGPEETRAYGVSALL